VTDRDNPGGGGLTGATGDLTPDVPDAAFDPGERREVEGPDRASVTHAQASGAPAQQDELGDPGGDASADGPTNMAERESGYGSEHGLSPRDPAYRMDETHPPAAGEPAPPRETRIGGDDLADAEERF
jgi:hypothetical protein